MELRTVTTGAEPIVELVSDAILIKDPQDALDVIVNAPSHAIVLHEHNFAPEFFDLSTRKLGELLQKCANYHVKLGIVGDFSKYPSKALRAFICETNKYGDFLFVSSVEEVIRIWQRGQQDSQRVNREPQQDNALKSDLPAGLAQPALQALIAAGYNHLDQLAKVKEADLLKLHGIGPKALGLIRGALSAGGQSFADPD